MFTNAQENRKYFPYIIEVAKYLYNHIVGFERSTFKFKFTSLSEMLIKFGSTNLFIKRLFPQEIGK
jgi:hypothetical protein